jgi:hypothetical protein
LKDSDHVREQETKKKRDGLATVKAQEAWALAKQGSASDEQATKIGDIAGKRRGEKIGFAGALFDGIAAAIQRGIQDGVANAGTLQAVIPATAVGGRETGG